MIFERTMMLGFTLRNDIPTSSQIVTFAWVILRLDPEVEILRQEDARDQREEPIADHHQT